MRWIDKGERKETEGNEARMKKIFKAKKEREREEEYLLYTFLMCLKHGLEI